MIFPAAKPQPMRKEVRSARPLRRLLGDSAGISAVEFGLIAPVFFIMIFGGLDLLHTVYAKTVLRGAVEEAARDASLETGNVSEIDAYVSELMGPILPKVKTSTTRMSYFDFKDINRPESWTDTNGNGKCDEGEPFVDENDSGQWEADVGVAGNGDANDIVIYTTVAKYKPLFPVPFIEKLQEERTLTAQTVVKNQPYHEQVQRERRNLTCD